MKKFLNKDQIKINKSGYLTDLEGNPISNTEFNKLQKKAHEVVLLSAFIKGKDFTGKKAVSKEQVIADFAIHLTSLETPYLSALEAPKRKLTDGLKKEAMDFLNFHKETKKIDDINKFLQQFNVLQEFSEFGLFFESKVVKLNKLYTIEDVAIAAKSVINFLEI